MSILDQDIQLRASLLLDDTDEGGGAMSADVIESGTVGNLGIVVADLDRTTGFVFLRKVFPHVDTANRDTYYKTTVIVSDPPDDANVGACLFTTGSFFDTRDGARDRLERYLAPSVRWPGRVLEMQLTGQRAVTLLLGLEDELPDVGSTLYLVQDEGEAGQVEQYIRVMDVTSEQRTFTVTEGSQVITFQGLLVTLEISEPLRYDFEGLPPGRRDDEAARTVLRDTIVADAAAYFGVSPLAAPGAVNDLHIEVDNIYTRLVPAAESETALVDLDAAGQFAPVVAAGGSTVTFSTAAAIGPGLNLYLGTGCVPGTLAVSVTGGTVTDSRGDLKLNGTAIGSIDYARGLLSFAAAAPTLTGTKTVTFQPGARPATVGYSDSIPVSAENRGYVYAVTLTPKPGRGALTASYLSLGRWYDLRDQGDGSLAGSSPAYGSGYLSASTGTVTLTLGALPDIGSEIIFGWGNALAYEAD